MLFGSLYVCTFQPGNSTAWGSEGVKQTLPFVFLCKRTPHQEPPTPTPPPSYLASCFFYRVVLGVPCILCSFLLCWLFPQWQQSCPARHKEACRAWRHPRPPSQPASTEAFPTRQTHRSSSGWWPAETETSRVRCDSGSGRICTIPKYYHAEGSNRFCRIGWRVQGFAATETS